MKPFLYMTKAARQTFEYIENKKSFWGKTKSIFKGFSVSKNVIRSESAPLTCLCVELTIITFKSITKKNVTI